MVYISVQKENAMITEEQVSEKVFWYLRANYKTLKDASIDIGCSSAYLSAVQTGAKQPSKKILDIIGVEKKTVYLEK